MDYPDFIVIVGDNNGNPAKLQTQLKPVQLKGKFGLAVKSYFHGEVFNIHENNNLIEYYIPDLSPIALAIFQRKWNYSDEDMKNLPIYKLPHKLESCKLPIGYYPSVISILDQLQNTFKDIYIETDRASGLKEPLDFVCKLTRNGFIQCYASNFVIDTTTLNGPWSLLEFEGKTMDLLGFKVKFVKNREFGNDVIPSFMHVNIIENSYINSKRSKVLSEIPIQMKGGWSYFEFLNIKSVPISVSEFSKITIDIKDKQGNYVKFNPKFPGIINLKIEPLI